MKAFKLTIAAIAASFTMSCFAAGPDWPPAPWTRIANKKEATSCCDEGGKVAIACPDCKSINETADKKVAGSFFDKNATHDCSGCKGKMTVKQLGGGKGPVDVKTTHECSKCGKDSPFTCATHVKK
jgi:hypothetical protein